MILNFIRLAVLVFVIAYAVWIVRSFILKRYRTATVLIFIGLLVLSGAVFAVHKLLALTKPYVIAPLSVSVAAPDAKVGCSISGRALSVVSSNNVVCVVDPGASFQYEVLWLVPRPPTTPAQELLMYKYELPVYADPNHVNGLDAEVPAGILEVATGERWK